MKLLLKLERDGKLSFGVLFSHFNYAGKLVHSGYNREMHYGKECQNLSAGLFAYVSQLFRMAGKKAEYLRVLFDRFSF